MPRPRKPAADGRNQVDQASPSFSTACATGIRRLLVDAITEHEAGRRLVAVKNVTVSEEFFQGHFPGAPLMPGVLMLESLSQVAAHPAAAARRRAAEHPRLPARASTARKFRRQVVPGDRLRLEVTLGRRRASLAAPRPRPTAATSSSPSASCCSGWSGSHRDRSDARIVHPRAQIGQGTTIGPHAIDRPARPDRRELPDRRVGGRRRLDRDRRRHRDLPVRVDRPGAAGPQVPRRADAAGHRRAATSSASS